MKNQKLNHFDMKNLVKLLFLVCCVCLLDACNDNQQEGGKTDPIVDCTITPIHGGAVITYTIPSDRGILYVMAEYERSGKSYTVISSVFDNSLTIEGFNSTDQVNVTLYTVNDNNTKSEPKNIVFNPLESPISLTYKSSKVYPCFGGIYIEWENFTETELGLRLMVEEDGEWVEKEMYFSSIPYERRAFRPFESEETKFEIIFEDKWGNVSEPILFVGTPYFETEVAKPWTDVRYLIPHDNGPPDQSPLTGMWDNSTALVWGVAYYRSNSASEGNSFTFDIGQVVKLSRMIQWPIYLPDYAAVPSVYGNVQVLDMEIWGTTVLDPAKIKPAGNPDYWLHPYSAAQTGKTPPWTGSFADLTPEQIQAMPDNFAKDWVYLGRYPVERLDLIGGTEMDIRQQGVDGFKWDIPDHIPPVRYLRCFPIRVFEGSPPPNNYWTVAEMSLFGDTTVPQE